MTFPPPGESHTIADERKTVSSWPDSGLVEVLLKAGELALQVNGDDIQESEPGLPPCRRVHGSSVSSST